jgi:hypothetical protein
VPNWDIWSVLYTCRFEWGKWILCEWFMFFFSCTKIKILNRSQAKEKTVLMHLYFLSWAATLFFLVQRLSWDYFKVNMGFGNCGCFF